MLKNFYKPFSLAFISTLIAVVYVIKNNGSGSGDLSGFLFWSCFAGLLAYPFLRLFSRWCTNRSLISAYIVGAIVASIYVVCWTYLVSMILGPWMMAFSFPVFICWLGGSMSAFLLVVVEKNVATWPIAIVVLLLTPALIAWGIEKSSPIPPPDIHVILKPGVSPNQVEGAWKLFQTPATPTWEGYNPEGVAGTGSWDSNDQHGFQLTFHANSDSLKRDAFIKRIIASPIVSEVEEFGNQNGKYVSNTLKYPSEDINDIGYLELDSELYKKSSSIFVIDSIIKEGGDKYCWYTAKIIRIIKNPLHLFKHVRYAAESSGNYGPDNKSVVYFGWYNERKKTGLKIIEGTIK